MYFAAQKVSADTLAGIISYAYRAVSRTSWSPDIAASFEMMMLTVCRRKSKLPPTPLYHAGFRHKDEDRQSVSGHA